MKIKYLRLSKEERKEVRKKFFETDKGILVRKKLNRSIFCSVFCILFGLYLLVDAYINTHKTWDYIYGTGILVIGIIMIFFYFKIRAIVINNYITKDTSKKKKNKK